MGRYFLITLFFLQTATWAQEGRTVDVWFGTAANKLELKEGVYSASFSQDAAHLSKPTLLYEMPDAGWVHVGSKAIYSTGTVDGQPSVVSFLPSADLHSESLGSGSSCFVTLDRTETILISAQYGAGSVAVFPVNDDGSLGKQSQYIQHEGGSGIRNQQQSPHPHYVAISPDNRFAFVPDLGLDQLVVYHIDLGAKKLLPCGRVDVAPGGGPRHMKFHPSGNYAFVLNELALAITVFRYDSRDGSMQKIETIPTLSASEKNENRSNSGSEIRVHPSGKSVYAANRGHDSISCFTFDEQTGKLARSQVAPIHGSWPRNFALSPAGDKMLVAGRDSNSVTIFQVNGARGTLQYWQHGSVFVPAPICVAFYDK